MKFAGFLRRKAEAAKDDPGLRDAIDRAARARMRARLASDGRGALGPWSPDNGPGAFVAWPVIHTEVAADRAAFHYQPDQPERNDNAQE